MLSFIEHTCSLSTFASLGNYQNLLKCDFMKLDISNTHRQKFHNGLALSEFSCKTAK